MNYFKNDENKSERKINKQKNIINKKDKSIRNNIRNLCGETIDVISNINWHEIILIPLEIAVIILFGGGDDDY